MQSWLNLAIHVGATGVPLEILKGSLLLKAQMCTGGRQGTGASVNDSEAPLVIGVDPLVV